MIIHDINEGRIEIPNHSIAHHLKSDILNKDISSMLEFTQDQLFRRGRGSSYYDTIGDRVVLDLSLTRPDLDKQLILRQQDAARVIVFMKPYPAQTPS